jgi:hypothetical protein
MTLLDPYPEQWIGDIQFKMEMGYLAQMCAPRKPLLESIVDSIVDAAQEEWAEASSSNAALLAIGLEDQRDDQREEYWRARYEFWSEMREKERDLRKSLE